MILVTGATGTVGRAVVTELLARGAAVRAAVTDPARAELPAEVARTRLVFGDPATYRDALAGVDAVFLMRPPQIADVARRIHPFVDAAVGAGVARIAFLSLQGVERNPVVPHARVEAKLREGPLGWTMLRPSFFMQNLSQQHRADIRDLGEIVVPAGRGRTSFVDARDVGAVAAVVLSGAGHEGRAYELTGRDAFDYHHVASTLSCVLGRTIRYRAPSIPRYWRRRRALGDPLPYILVTTALYTAARLGLAAGTSDELERLLGRPPTPLARFAADHREVWAAAP